MRLLVSGATRTLRRYAHSPYLGALLVPDAGNRPDSVLTSGQVWAADNAAFSGFDPGAFCRMLARIAGRPGCRFVACPDVVGDARATLAQLEVWQPVLTQMGLPVALVAQDGAEGMELPWGRFQRLFLGGSTAWKLGHGAARLAQEARRRGLWLHLGRCNSKKRFRHAFLLGCDSIDGSGFSRWPDQRIPQALRWLAQLHGHATDLPESRAVRVFFRNSTREGLGLLGRAGWVVDEVRQERGVYVVLARCDLEPAACPRCGVSMAEGGWLYRHGWRRQMVRDVPRQDRPVRLSVKRRRYRCRACETVFTQPLPGVNGAWTEDLLAYVASHAARRSRGEMARAIGVDAKTLRRVLVPLGDRESYDPQDRK